MTEIAGGGTGAARERWGREASHGGARERQREGTMSRKGKEHRNERWSVYMLDERCMSRSGQRYRCQSHTHSIKLVWACLTFTLSDGLISPIIMGRLRQTRDKG